MAYDHRPGHALNLGGASTRWTVRVPWMWTSASSAPIRARQLNLEKSNHGTGSGMGRRPGMVRRLVALVSWTTAPGDDTACSRPEPACCVC